MTPNTETTIKVYGDVGWSEEEFSLFLEMLNIGLVMSHFKERYAGQYDGGVLSCVVRDEVVKMI